MYILVGNKGVQELLVILLIQNNQKYIRNPHCVPEHTKEYKSNYYVRKRSNYLIQKLLHYVLVMV